jgi:UDP-4-amino-4,6-dideoxy-N-acetyl-beta-L-altrosamine transaminase
VIPYGRQDVSDDDVAAVVNALRAPLITQGPLIDAFEEQLAEIVGARFAVAVNSGTAALHAAYFAAGIQPGRSVLTTPITFAATANASLYLGGGVRFADVTTESGLLDPSRVEANSASDVKVLAPVHYCGHVAAMEELRTIAERRGWLVVEDAAHALGADFRGRDGRLHRVGSCSHSDMCCFSFHPVKHVTTGEGGAVTTNDPELYRRLRRFRTHGITRDPNELQHDEGPWYYEQQDLGYNYRITDFQSALGSSQLRRLDNFVQRRREHAVRYNEAFAGIAGIRPIESPANSDGSYHLYVIRVAAEDRRGIFEDLRQAGIGVNVHYIPVYRHPYYRANGWAQERLPNAEALYASIISLPMFPDLTADERSYVVDSVIRAVSERGVGRAAGA